MRVGVDVRPLTAPLSGIGRYLDRVLTLLMHDHPQVDWYLYADRPFRDNRFMEGTIRDHSNHIPLLSPLRTQVTFSRWARRDQLDIFWSPRHHLPLMLPSGSARLLTIHDLVWCHYPDVMQFANRWLERMLMPPSVEAADRILAVSAATANDLASVFPGAASKTVVTPLAADGLPVPASEEFGNDYFLFVGTMEPRKNLSSLLRAFAIVQSELPESRLVIAGAQGWMPEISSETKRLGVDHVEVLGRVTDEQLAALYKNALVFVFPSLYEGFGLPVLEAMQAGTAVIASNASSLPEVVADCGLLVAPEDSAAIAQAMIYLYQNQEVRDDFARRGADRSRLFSWQHTADLTWKAMESLYPG